MNNSASQATVCVIMPMFNSEHTIIRALESISAQTRLPDKVVVVNDGSTDSSPELVAKYQAPYELHLISQENQGPSAARNRGITAAEEELVCFLDADDQWIDTKLEKQLNLYQQLTDKGHAVGIIDCFEQILSNDGKNHLCNRVKHGEHFNDFIVRNIINGTSCVMVKRQSLIEVGLFDSEIRFAEDRWLWTQIAEFYQIHTVPEVLSYRHIGDGNITSNPSKYFTHKKQFVEKFIAKYQSQFTDHQLSVFVFNNLYEFQRSFFDKKDYLNVIFVYKKMFKRSWRVLFFNKGKATIGFLISVLMSRLGGGHHKEIEAYD
ncbi:glycosyltransferase family 2 protein [Vibrio hippocampi]|uniref:Glycosyltransferase 2-like domain-containing protein n=1 Tax=Vibrio hippocampi TaxID=654686 RepID=A0ABN8DIW9_9VIBR|nr:glycosyltransferase family 2 protein [Vibrio hippocampi]CAH0529064.1 hypothetical protein VHP8226_03032 [Vibrio hippocampi]